MGLALFLGGVCGGCGQKSSQHEERKDAGQPGLIPTAPVDLPEITLGLSAAAAFSWRKRAGQPAFRAARRAEAREEWDLVIASCREALIADPGHLEASWLLAAALGKLGRTDEILAPLRAAVAGDFGKWGTASLELPALQQFLATPQGQAWRRRVDADRSLYLVSLARAIVVTAEGDLFGFDPDTARWYRLTRTSGAVIGGLAIPSVRKIAYVVRQAIKGKHSLAIGVVDLGRGRTTRAVELGSLGPLTVGYSEADPVGFWIGTGGPKPVWRVLEDDYKVEFVPVKAVRPTGPARQRSLARSILGPARQRSLARSISGPRLEITASGARLLSLPVATVTADWDDAGLASAIRIGSSNRVISAPSPGLIDGNTASWSPSKSHLAFVAQLAETCAPGPGLEGTGFTPAISSAAYIADAATGKLQEIERAASGLAIEWLTDRKLVVAGDKGVTIIDLDGAEPRILEDATDLVAPRKRARCDEQPVEEPPIVEDPESQVGVEPTNGGVVEPP